MQFENSFEVAGAPLQVIPVFEDLPLLASFLPGASIGERNEDGSYPGTLLVSFGPKKLSFKGKLKNRVDCEQLSGELVGQASADIRGAKMLVTMTYRLSPVAAGTRVDLVSDAELTGMLAEFARTGGVVLTQALLEEFSKRFSEHMRAQLAPVFATAGAAAQAPRAALRALSAFTLLLQAVKWLFRRRPSPPRG